MKNFTYPEIILEWFEKRFPNGNEPFQMITRLCEEAGELAKEVNHAEGSGIKFEKHGPPSKDHMAQEIQDVIRCALAVAKYYGIESELEESIRQTELKAEMGLKGLA